MFLDFKDKKIYDGYSGQKYKTPVKEKIRLPSGFCTAYSVLEGLKHIQCFAVPAKPLGKEIRQFLLGNAMLTRISTSQELTTTIADFLLLLHLGYGSCGLAVASSPCILFIVSIFFSLVSRLKRQPFALECETFHSPGRGKKKTQRTSRHTQRLFNLLLRTGSSTHT